MVLVAHDGEWTRRRVDGDHGARQLGQRLRIPVYDVAVIGYPQRMRDYTARQRILREREEPRHYPRLVCTRGMITKHVQDSAYLHEH
jgi:hypothetical protein